MNKRNKVLFFKPLLNWLLGHCYIVFLVVLTGIISFILIFEKNDVLTFITSHNFKLSQLQENLLATFIASGLSTILTVILLIIKKNFKGSRQIKRKLYNACNCLYKNKNVPKIIKKLISYSVNLFYFYNRELIHQQQYVVDDILNSLNDVRNSSKNIYWIQGSPYSGKTITILNLFIDLISKMQYHRLFQKLDGKIVYYDLGKDDIDLENLLVFYETEKFSNCLIVFDNLHKLSGKKCLRILEKFVLNNHTFGLIILLRRPEDFLSENDKINQLKKIILQNGKEYVLSPLNSYSFNIYDEENFNNFCRDFFALEDIIKSNEITIHLYMLYLRRNYDSSKLIPAIKSFFCHKNNTVSAINLAFITIISCSIFTGGFNINLLIKCYPSNFKMKWRSFLDGLIKIGFLTNYPNSHEDFYFHEKIAKFYFKESTKNQMHNIYYMQIFEKLSKIYETDSNNCILKFLYCMLAKDVIRSKKLFNNVVTNVNFFNLYEEIIFLFQHNICDITCYYREIGVLCDRCGKLYKARKYYSLYLDKSKSVDAFYKLVQIDHKVIYKYPEIKLSALKSSDLYIKILSNYWEIHVNLHNGIFEFQKLLDLACEFEKKAEEIIEQYQYDGFHLMRRLYFDVFRLYYLEGIFKPEKLKTLTNKNSKMFRILKNKIDEFEAYYIKFAIGMMLGQDVLFSLAFENKGLNFEEYSFLFTDYLKIYHHQTCDVKVIAEETIRIYLQAIELFNKIGDKTAMFVKYHMYNIKLLLVEDGNFSECERFYEDYMIFSTKENILEYKAYAETFKLKMSLIQLCSPAIIDSYGNDQYDELINTIREKLELIKKYEELVNQKRGNNYALIRLRLYSILFSLFIKEITTKEFEKQVQKLKEQVVAGKYNRELKIIHYIQKSNYKLSPESIRVIFCYYPIVPQ